MNTVLMLDALICGAICARLILYRRRGADHRPLASAIAYLLIVAAGVIPLRALFGLPHPVSVAQLILNAVLCLAVFSVRGNVVDLFRCSDAFAESRWMRILRRKSWF
ncbi:phage holin family protein [Paludibacterium paludis]|uniref:3TM holin n=1 Tax=Paludibacterium paludis TaxID=1225769 RepID=A0A918NXC0_9NEIS|nr:phage holin family protein [Paludibacterium paludis]GGY03855.1 hypothetical protein GCM10011289_02750 [Paludibacterium paludis]